MKYRSWFSNLAVMAFIYAIIRPVYAESTDYLTSFKVPAQQTFCISKSANGDMAIYKKCMLAVEKGSYKCDKVTKPAFEEIVNKYSEHDMDVPEYMNGIKPIIEKHFECLNTLY